MFTFITGLRSGLLGGILNTKPSTFSTARFAIMEFYLGHPSMRNFFPFGFDDFLNALGKDAPWAYDVVSTSILG